MAKRRSTDELIKDAELMREQKKAADDGTFESLVHQADDLLGKPERKMKRRNTEELLGEFGVEAPKPKPKPKRKPLVRKPSSASVKIEPFVFGGPNDNGDPTTVDAGPSEGGPAPMEELDTEVETPAHVSAGPDAFGELEDVFDRELDEGVTDPGYVPRNDTIKVPDPMKPAGDGFFAKLKRFFTGG